MSSASSAIAGPSQSKVETNSRGIPHAPFISNVQEYLGGPDEEVEPTLKKFQETMSKYKFMELNTAQRRRGLEEKIPDIRKTLQMVTFLKDKKDDPESIETTFELNDTLYAKAKLDPVNTVHLWLGANVMLEYPLDEAISLLTGKLSGAEKSLTTSKEDLDFLREQITIMEVNTARVHNWDVKRRRERREQLERDGLTEGASKSQASWLSDDRDKSETNTSRAEKSAQPSENGLDEQEQHEERPTADDQTVVAAKSSTSSTPAEEAMPASATMTPDVAQSTSVKAQDSPEEDAPVPPAADQQQAHDVVAAGNPIDSVLPNKQPKESTSTTVPPPIDRSHLPASLTTPTSTDPSTSHTLIVPPLNFAMVSRGIYRSGHPNERNFEFLRRLNLKSVLYLGTEDYRSNMTNWTASQGIQTFHLRLAINKEPTAEMDEKDVVKALQLILTPSNWPILVHCNKGLRRAGVIVGLLRRLQGWSHTSIFEEYSRFAGTKISDLEYIEVFDLDQVKLT
uniref:Protein tyrosine phosphatase n=1 Tax=Kalmanozyma brasiliensis (strain GHG001) TaxID=1365824 RepID=V5F2I9_KALBG